MNDFFALFGLPVGFEIDENLLKNNYLALQKQHHPDRAGDKNAEQNTALINHAFKTLSNSDSRAVYLLELAGTDFNSDKSISDERFLMAMMDYRMALDDAIFDKNESVIKELEGQVLDELNQTSQDFNQSYQAKDYQAAQTIAQKLKFLANLRADITDSLTKLKQDDDDSELYV